MRTRQTKQSGVEWMGDIPAHWKIKEIRHLVPRDRQVMYGIVLPGPNVDKGVPIVKAGNCEPGRLAIEFMHRTTFEIESGYARSRLRAGDIVFAIRGSFGQAEIVPPELEGANLTQDAARIAPGAATQNRWLWYAVHSQSFFRQMDSVAVGATIRGVNIRDLKRGKLAVPPLAEQRRIAGYLDEATGKIDRLLGLRRRQMELLQEQRAALIQQAVTRGLNPNAPLKPSGLQWLGDIPKHWDVKPMKYVFNSLDGRRIPLSGADRQLMTRRDYDYYGASGIIDRVNDYIFDETLILIGEDGANLLNRSTPLAFLATGKYWVNNHAHVMKPRRGLIEYLVHLLEAIDFTPHVGGSAQPKLTLEKLMSVKIPEPPLTEQEQIARFIHQENDQFDRLHSAYVRQLELLSEYRAALIHECVTGQRVVPSSVGEVHVCR